MKKFALLPIAAALPFTVLAAQPEKSIERISVTAARAEVPVSTVPATISVISAEQIQSQLAFTQDISKILGNLIPAFSPSREKMSNAGEKLRGRDPLYMIDGVPQSNPLRSGGRAGRTIDPAMIERIEVIHGSNAIQGMGASGGIINIITKSAGENTHSVSAGFTKGMGSDTTGYKASYLYSAGERDNGVVAGISYKNNGMYRDGDGTLVGVDTTQGDTMDSQSFDAFLKLAYRLDKNQTVKFMINHYNIQGNGDYGMVTGDVESETPATSVKADQPGDAPRNKITTASVDYKNTDVLSGQLSIQLFYQNFAALYGATISGTFQDPTYGENIYDQSQNRSTKFGSRLTWFKSNLAGMDLDLITGLDYLSDETYQELALTNRIWVPKTTFDNYAPFLQLRYKGIEDFTFSYGARYEYGKLNVDDFTTLASANSTFVEGGDPSFNELMHNFGAVWQTTDKLRLYASYSEGFNMPDVGRVLRGINTAGLSVNEFLNLQPVISDNTELGFEWIDDSWQIRTSYFESESDLGSRLSMNDDGIYLVRREKTEISGFEADAQWFVSNTTTLGAAYANTKGQYDSDGDSKVDSDLDGTNIAPNRLNIYWQQIWNDAISSRLQLNHLADKDFNASPDFEGYNTVDLMLNYRTNTLGSFTLGVDNLTDEQYISYYGQTTANAVRYFAGRGRQVSLNWNMDF
ncbi:TonB-dependent receptor [Catenovulum sp. 2E275]|uniref:TonB-dependent receptor n=1 Tax=Catenovulum sp. 2E275 TaxID=2980497 RepID=UPI0021CEBC1F|nr:TonB-dependent receptor [Catenovulum sp. 2E275]MCU4677033.1 TonB-dependent receptor [Catenovulum sp. 2E275]